MKNLILFLLTFFFLQLAIAQPPAAKQDVITDPPPKAVRTLAEWEELEAIALTYDTRYDSTKKQLIAEIARHAKEEVKVLIYCGGISGDLINLVKYEFDRTHNFDNQNNLFFIKKDFNERVWIRDFGAHTVYEENVGKRLFIDWLYDFDFQNADLISTQTAEFFTTDLHTTSTQPSDLKLDGGNFQSDGLGTAIASSHIFDDNPLSFETDIDRIANNFMGIENFIKLEKLPFDKIHHVDMHLKLLDEETLLVGEYPRDTADGPQIEANLDYLLNNFKTSFGSDFKIHRIPMPADRAGNFPHEIGACSDKDRGCYYTYTNAFFINELILVPTYFDGQGADIQALKQWEEMMPGYKIVGIDCSEIIKEYGAIHCVTKEIGVQEPLRIIHQKIHEVCETDEFIAFSTRIQHVSGIKSASVFYSTDKGQSFKELPLENIVGEEWGGELPNFPKGTNVTYFFRAIAQNGKTIARPMPAEKGGWTFEINCKSSTISSEKIADFDLKIYPNPFNDFVKIELSNENFSTYNLLIYNSLGELLKKETLSSTTEIEMSDYAKGVYFFEIENEGIRSVRKVVKF